MITYVLKDPTSGKDTPIYMTAYFAGRRMKYGTGLSINPAQWNKSRHRARQGAKGADSINTYLDRLETIVREIQLRLKSEMVAVTPDRVRDELNRHMLTGGGRESLVDFADRYANEVKLGVESRKVYRTVANYLKAYPGQKEFEDVDAKWLAKYQEYLERKGKAANTIGKHITYIRNIMTAAVDAGLTNNVAYKSRKYRKPSEESDTIYLNETELLHMYGVELPDHLDRVRDRWLVGAFTALRFADFSKINHRNIVDGMLVDRNNKTGTRVVIPLHWVVRQILEKYRDLGGLPPAISNQKMNDYIKLVAKRAGIEQQVIKHITRGGVRTSETLEKWRLVTTHTARRSGATNMYLNGIPAISIMKITGHKTERSFLKYIRISGEENAALISTNQFFSDPSTPPASSAM